jgi:hypothetical protein
MAASRPRVLNSAGVVVAVLGVALQGRGWPHRTDSDGDGAPAGLTSRFDPAESREKGSRVQPAPFEGAVCQPYRSGRHSVTELTMASSHSSPQWRGWASPRELAEQRWSVISRRVMARLSCVRALNAHTCVRELVRP